MPYLKWRREIKDQRMRTSSTPVIEINLNVDTTAVARKKNAYPAAFYSPLVLVSRYSVRREVKTRAGPRGPRTGFSAN